MQMFVNRPKVKQTKQWLYSSTFPVLVPFDKLNKKYTWLCYTTGNILLKHKNKALSQLQDAASMDKDHNPSASLEY